MNENVISTIEGTCKQLSETRAQLRKKFESRQKAINAIDIEHTPEIRRLQERCALLRSDIDSALKSSRELFRKPKTRTFCGIVVGFEKQRDSIIMPEESQVVANIDKILPKDQADTLLDRSVTLIKAAFKKLPKETLQLLGCSKVSGADKPVIQCQDDDIESLVTKSLGESAEKKEVA